MSKFALEKWTEVRLPGDDAVFMAWKPLTPPEKPLEAEYADAAMEAYLDGLGPTNAAGAGRYRTVEVDKTYAAFVEFIVGEKRSYDIKRADVPVPSF